MLVRRSENVRIRADKFGGICYVPHRDDFFAVDRSVFQLLTNLSKEWTSVAQQDEPAVSALAKIGILATEPRIAERSYSGVGFLGNFKDIPTVSKPLVVNCFCTAHCPLKCTYCHADDLMQDFRVDESQLDLENVAATALQVDAIVAVITGGDPLTRPDRAAFLIEKLSKTKALVLDTSGVGDIEPMLPLLKKHDVHVRISLDAVSSLNDKLRPINRQYVSSSTTSRAAAEHTIRRCVSTGIPVTVQSVICSQTENISELSDLRDSLVDWGVRHWVLHLTVKAGSARRIELAAEKHSRKRGILPSRSVRGLLSKLIADTEQAELPLDIRCTDTDNTPNSVLLIGSRGNLYTEGLAHNGKLELYNVSDGKSDEVKSLWHYVDKFGHARRYLNWTEWLAAGKDLRDICYTVPTSMSVVSPSAAVENEAKFRVPDPQRLAAALATLGFEAGDKTFQRDEYFDRSEARLAEMDYVIRIRDNGTCAEAGLKGPRSYTKQGYSRIEIEVPVTSAATTRDRLEAKGYKCTWYFEKRRTKFLSPEWDIVIVLDEVPKVGCFVEFEGATETIGAIWKKLEGNLGEVEQRNYAEVFRAFEASRGVDPKTIVGAEFKSQDINQ